MEGLPRGTVTFLFTDVQDSTALVRRLKERYADILADHRRLLREAFAEHGGHEIDTQATRSSSPSIASATQCSPLRRSNAR